MAKTGIASHRQTHDPPWRLLRDQEDHHTFQSELDEEAQSALVEFIAERWKNFDTAFHAAERNVAYNGLMNNLMMRWNQEWWPGWIVHWRIQPNISSHRSVVRFEDYALLILKLERRR